MTWGVIISGSKYSYDPALNTNLGYVRSTFGWYVQYRTNPYCRRYDRMLSIKEQAVATTVTQSMILTTTVCYCGAAITYVLQVNV